MPWAAPRCEWNRKDWALPFFQTVSRYVDLSTADYLVPAPLKAGVCIGIDVPVQPARYMAALNVFRRVLVQLPSIVDAKTWSLHSPRFFLPSVAGQMRFSLEDRRTLGRWGPSSHMPVRYDRARCVAELCLKAEVMSSLKQGFVPGSDSLYRVGQ